MSKTLLFAGFVALLGTPALAHHSFAMYDLTQTKSATGRLIRFIPGANHAQLHFELIDDAGKTVMKEGKPSIMGVETGSAAQLARLGVTVDEFPLGTIITVAYHPLRDGRPLGALAGELVRCGKDLPKGGCSKATGQLFLTGNSQ